MKEVVLVHIYSDRAEVELADGTIVTNVEICDHSEPDDAHA